MRKAPKYFILGLATLSALSFSLSGLETVPGHSTGKYVLGDTVALLDNAVIDRFNCVSNLDTNRRDVKFIFSADSMFEGAAYALDVMDSLDIKASFFFTGNFLRDSVNYPVIERIVNSGHYVGPHSDRHILLAEWDRDRTPLVSADSLLNDIMENYRWLGRFGITPENAPIILPPFEWCSASQAVVYRNNGLVPILPSPRIETYRDYTTPDMKEYRSSDEMLKQLYDYEKDVSLNGAIIIIHLGTQDVRTDKLYHHLPEIFNFILSKGYTITPL